MNNIDTYIVNPRSQFCDFISYDIAPEEFHVSVLETETAGNTTYTVIDGEEKRIYVCAVSSSRKAVESYIDWIYGRVQAKGNDENPCNETRWASDCVNIIHAKDEWEIVEEN